MNSNETQKIPNHFKRVLNLIGEGKENATKVKEITRLTGMNSETVRFIVSKAVTVYGIGIATSPNGYYYITNIEEKTETYRNLTSRAYKLLERAKVISNLPPKGQQQIEFDN